MQAIRQQMVLRMPRQLAELRKTPGWSETLPQEIVDAVLASGSNYDVIVACYEDSAAGWIIDNMTARLDHFEYTQAAADGMRIAEQICHSYQP